MSYFSDNYDMVRYPQKNAESKTFCLRNAQIGAIHSIAAHVTLGNDAVAIIVMPTGSGKTTVLMMAPYVLRKSKVLLVTPSAMVRGQICEDFRVLKTLKRIGVFEDSVPNPVIYEACHEYSAEDTETYDNFFKSADVVIATHQVAATISEQPISSVFDYIMIDEAHHVPAPTWQKILHNMSHSQALLVTATPFRLDRKQIRGDCVYNYSLAKAYRDGIFGEIEYIPIQEAPGKDQLIAQEAERVFINDRSLGFNHSLMVRTDSKEKAKDLEKLYRDITVLRLKRIDSTMAFSTVRKAIEQMRIGALDGIICINMLGEGFDFPNLKIAAIHEPHKSLAATLQFIGRFARTNADNIGTAKFIAMNDRSLQIENQHLYSSDSVWQNIIINMSEEKIGGDLQNSSILDQFSKPEIEDNAIVLSNIRPNCHAKVYRVPDFNIEGIFPDELCVGENIYRNIELATVIGISRIDELPIWLVGDQAVNSQSNLYIVHYQKETGLLFLYSQAKTDTVYESVAKSFSSRIEKIPRNEMHRVLAGFSNYEFFNTGMQNRNAEAGESYRIYAGSNTAASIDENTGKMLSAGHAFCKVLANEGDKTIGYSSGSKIWSSSFLSIPEYVKWCDMYGKKIVDKSLKVKTNTNFDRLPIPFGINRYDGKILFCLLSEETYSSPPLVRLDDCDSETFLLTDVAFNINEVSPSREVIYINATIAGVTDQLACDVLGNYTARSSKIAFCDGRRHGSLADYLNSNPLFFKTSDGTVYLGNEVLIGNHDLENFDTRRICNVDWDILGTDISNECKWTNTKRNHSIQESLKLHLDQDDSLSHIFFDHGTGEIADFVTFMTEGSSIQVCFYHAKSMKGKTYNSNVSDVYEVAQQAVKSVVWLKSKTTLLNKIERRYIRSTGNSKFFKGNFQSLKGLLQSQRILEATIFIVQPAISKNLPMEEAIDQVLSAASFYIRNTARAKELRILGSY
nr:DEAD/DEAH box helicase family protein [uncultured Sphaerochaeta sp.]